MLTDLTKPPSEPTLTPSGPRRIYSAMRNEKNLPGLWRLHVITTDKSVTPSGNDHDNAELFAFRADGSFDKHLKVEGKIETLLKNQKWVKGPRSIFIFNNNKPYYEVDMVTHDTLVLKARGTNERRVYKKVK